MVKYFYDNTRMLFGTVNHLGNGNHEVNIWHAKSEDKLHPDDMLHEDLLLERKGLSAEVAETYFHDYQEIDPEIRDHNDPSTDFRLDIGVGD